MDFKKREARGKVLMGTVSTPRLSMEPGLAGGQGAVPGVGTCCLSTLPRH